MRTKILTMQIFVLFLISIILIAQEDQSVKEKLKKIEGDVSKIVITSEKGEVVFEGKEAKELLNRMKSKKIHKKLHWVSEDGEDFDVDGENVMIFKSDKGGKHIIKEIDGSDNIMIMKHVGDEDLHFIKEGAKKIKVEVEEENGEKKVTITTNEDGEEKIEVFEGKEADEYLDEMNEDGEMIIDIDYDVDSDSDLVWIHEDGDKNRIEKDLKIEIKDGVKKVTETTTENGEKKVTVYEGDDAERYLKENGENGKHIKIKHKMLDGKKHKKIIIKEIIDKEEK